MCENGVKLKDKVLSRDIRGGTVAVACIQE